LPSIRVIEIELRQRSIMTRQYSVVECAPLSAIGRWRIMEKRKRIVILFPWIPSSVRTLRIFGNGSSSNIDINIFHTIVYAYLRICNVVGNNFSRNAFLFMRTKAGYQPIACVCRANVLHDFAVLCGNDSF